MGFVDKAKGLADDLTDKAKGVADKVTDVQGRPGKTKDVAGDAAQKAVVTAGPVVEKTKAVAGDAAHKPSSPPGPWWRRPRPWPATPHTRRGHGGPAVEKTKAVAGTLGQVVAGAVGDLKDKVSGDKG